MKQKKEPLLGALFLSSSLIKALYEHYESPQIDLLVNDDTIAIAKLIPFIKNIHTFSYQKKKSFKLIDKGLNLRKT